MGQCMSIDSTTVDKQANRASKEIDKVINQSSALESEKIKLLLLGAGESGKSTVFKQMRLLFGAPLSDEERMQITPIVYSNILSSMKILIQAVENMGYLENVLNDNLGHIDLISNIDENSKVDTIVGKAIKALWKDPGIQSAWNRRAEFQIVDSVKYYFNEIDRIMQDNYVASQQDMLLARVRTSGVVTERYLIDGKSFEMYDVGGQRNERKKWIHCFDDVTAVIFVAALSEYDQVLFEDSNTNRLVEAVQLFDEICNNRFFTKSNMILFLNKKDLFEEKIRSVHIGAQDAFKDFPASFGAQDYYQQGVTYILGKFVSKNCNTNRHIYNHVTCATDTKNVQVVFNACKDIILRGNLEQVGL